MNTEDEQYIETALAAVEIYVDTVARGGPASAKNARQAFGDSLAAAWEARRAARKAEGQ